MPILTFETTHHALWAEQIALDKNLGAQMVGAPKEAGSPCGMALETLPEDLPPLLTALGEAGVVYKVYEPA